MLNLMIATVLLAYTCGTLAIAASKGKAETRRIVGGYQYEGDSIPWIVSLQQENSDGTFSHRCGGALVAPEWVITSGHCLHEVDRACIGGTDLLQPSQFKCVALDGEYLHADYDAASYMNDLAFVRLSTPVTNEPAKLSLESVYDSPGDFGVVVGWGVTSTGIASHTLKRLDVEWSNQKECIGFGPPIEEPVHLSRLCTRPVNGEGPCHGDSGSPAYAIDDSGDLIIVGLVSLGSSRCAGKIPTVFMRMSYAVRWVLEFIASPPAKQSNTTVVVSDVKTYRIASPTVASVWHSREHCTAPSSSQTA